MVDIFYPQINQSTQHVGEYFDRTPVRTGTAAQLNFGVSQQFTNQFVKSIIGNVQSSFSDEPLITPEEYKSSPYYREGIEVPEEGLKESVAEALANAYDIRYKRNLTFSRVKRNFGSQAAVFGAGMAGSVFDPYNIGAAILAPVAVGLNATARAAATRAVAGVTSKYGVTAGRVVSGAGEAALATVPLEAISLIGSDIQQDPDYGLFESFVNLTLNSILGGAFVGVGGKFSDKLSRSNPETVVQSMRAATAQLSQGLPVRVETIQNADSRVGPAVNAQRKFKEDVRATQEVNVKPPKLNELPPSLKPAYQKKKPLTLTQFVKNNGKIDPDSVQIGDLKQRLDSGDFGVMKRGGKTIDEMALAAQEEGFFPSRVDPYVDRVTPEDLIYALEEDSGPGFKVYSSFDEDAKAYLDAVDLDIRVNDLNINPRGMTDEQLFEEIQIRENALTELEAFELDKTTGPGITREEIDNEIARVQADLEQAGDLEEFFHPQEEIDMLAQEYDMRFKSDDSAVKAADKDTESLMREVEAMRANNLITDEELAELADWNAVVARSDEMGSITEAGAYCVVRSAR